MDKNTHVYCTECRNGNKLINQLMKDEPFVEPENCKGCNSYNPEDSMRFELRPNYKKRRIRTIFLQLKG